MKVIVKKNVYDKYGRLIIAKGRIIKLDNNQLERLGKLGILDDVLLNNDKNLSDAIDKPPNIKDITKIFEGNYPMINKKSFIKTTEIIDDVIYNHRTKSWYVHLKSLLNYVDWIYTHSINTALLAGVIGIEMGYTEEKVQELVLGAMLHDIGMLLSPKSILLKINHLNKEEMQIIEKHCELGYAMIYGSGLPQTSQDIIKQHHERIDGSGYPNNLHNSDIIEAAQIVMVADIFDAATTSRPYSKAKDPFVAINEMIQANDKLNEKIVNTLKVFLFGS